MRDYSYQELEGLLRCANILPESPFEKYLIRFVLPKIIESYGIIPDEFITPELKNFSGGLRKSNPEALAKIDELFNKPLSPDDLAYYYILSNCSEHQFKIKKLFDTKATEKKSKTKEYCSLLEESVTRFYIMSKVKEEIVDDPAVEKVKEFSEYDTNLFADLVSHLSLFDFIFNSTNIIA